MIKKVPADLEENENGGDIFYALKLIFACLFNHLREIFIAVIHIHITLYAVDLALPAVLPYPDIFR